MTPLTVRLDHLDPSAYTLRVAYGVTPASISLTVNGVPLVPAFCREAEHTCTYRIPAELTAEGALVLTWCAAPGERGVRVAELWLSLAPGRTEGFRSKSEG